MTYTKTTWTDNTTPLSATNMNNLETQYDEAMADASAKFLDITSSAPNPQTVHTTVGVNNLTLPNGTNLADASTGSSTGGPRTFLEAAGGEFDLLNQTGTAYALGKFGSIATTNANGESGNITAAGSITSSAGELGSASGTWTPAGGSLNVAAGTVINVSAVPSGAKLYYSYDTTGEDTYGSPSLGYWQTWGVMTASGSAWTTFNPIYSSQITNYGYASAVSSTIVSGTTVEVVDGTYAANGYYQINNGYLQFVVTSSTTHSGLTQSNIRWGVS